jgi:hypothetical protein
MSDETVANVAENEEKSDSGAKAKSKNVKKAVKKPKKMVPRIDTEPSEILEWVRSGGDVQFDADDLPTLSEEELGELPYAAVKEYKAARKKKEEAALSSISDIETLSGNAKTKLKLRERRGYHQTWKRPDEFTDAKERGYVEIREKKKEDEKPGYETGEVIKIYKGQGDIELIAMEVSQERYDNHVRLMTKKSREAYRGNKEGFATSVEQYNRGVPKEARARIFDEEGDVN